ncbi:MAG: YwiC-like family protein [Planctomycetales bacterium]|nr:YwiC-like family protein [Planctomycetales bacterium]
MHALPANLSASERSTPGTGTHRTSGITSPASLDGEPRKRAASLHPKEHGAYAILAIPMVTAWFIAGPNSVGVWITLAAVAGFLAHEPLLVVWGHRGRRAQGNSPQALGRLWLTLSLTVFGGGVAFAIGAVAIRWALVACLAMASTSFAVALAGWHRRLLGQLWGVVGLSFPCVPIILSGGLSTATALMIWAVWLLGFAATTLAVRSVIAAQKRRPRKQHTIVLAFLSILLGGSLFVSQYWLLASLPMIVLSWYLLIAPPPARQLKRVGWTLVAGTLVSALVVVGIF